MRLNEILTPIHGDLHLVQVELDQIVHELGDMPSRPVFEHYFKIPGKLLRPSLLLLASATTDNLKYTTEKSKLIKAATAIELVHNASLIHDDIVDREMLRRGQKTINNVFGSKIAAIAGNALVARAVAIILEEFSKATALKIVQMIRKMSLIEIRQLNRNTGSGSREEYLELIKGKTALLMSNSCMIGSGIVTSDEYKIAALQQFGLNFGITYQIVDDTIDQDSLASRHVELGDAVTYARVAIATLEGFEASPYKQALLEMLEYVLSLTHINAETKVKIVNN